MRLLSLLAFAALALSASGCDTTDVYETRATYVDFRLDTSDRDNVISADGRVASFDDRDVISSDDQARLRSALARAGDGALVIAYVNSDLLFDGASTGQTYSALPLTRGYEAFIDSDGDGTLDTPLVDYTVSYEYSFDNEAFYFDVTSSAELLQLPVETLDVLIPAAIDFRVVTLPASAALGQAGARIDLRDYEAVKAAYGLPD